MIRQACGWGLITTAMLDLLPTPATARMVNLPGSIASGVEICSADDHRCIKTPADRETTVQVFSYRDGEGEAVVVYRDKRYVAQAGNVVIVFKGARISLASFIMGKLPPGMKR